MIATMVLQESWSVWPESTEAELFRLMYSNHPILALQHHALSTLTRTAKKAKSFETQKLVRKIKQSAASDGQPIKSKAPVITASQLAELEGVLVAMKGLSSEQVALHALRTRLGKDKTGLASLEEVVTFCAEKTDGTPATIDPTSAVGKAQNRVLASKAMADALNETLAHLRKKAGLSIAQVQQNRKGKADESLANDIKGKGKATSVPETEKAGRVLKRSRRASSEASTSTSESDDYEEDDESIEGLDSDDDSDATVSHISAEDAPPGADEDFNGFGGSGSEGGDSSDSDANSEDAGSVSSDTSYPTVKKKISRQTKEPESAPAKLDKKAKAALDRAQTAPQPPPRTSTFLPSLAGGYTAGDPDGSVYSYSGDEGAGGPASLKPERKNRRGQRARQACVFIYFLCTSNQADWYTINLSRIWEKKYGKSANHVLKKRKMEEETEENRRRTRAEKEIEHLKKTGRYVYGLESNLTSVAPGKHQRTWAATGEGQADTTTGQANKAKDVVKSKGGEEVLHPSWEARKKAKELQASMSSAKPAGKKIVFD